MEKELKDFINDWTVEPENFAAIHKEGLEFKYSIHSIEARKNLEIKNLPKWYLIQRTQGLTSDMVNKKLGEFKAEFIEIYHKIIITQNTSLYQP